MSSMQATPAGSIKVLAVILFLFGLLALVAGLFLYGEGVLWNPPPGIELGFPIADVLVNAPASILAAVGLWRMRKWGYAAAWFVVGFYIYASVEIFVLGFEEAPPYRLEIFIPQVLAVLLALALSRAIWLARDRFR